MLKTITPIDNSILVERNYSSNNEIETTLENAKTALRLWKNTPLKIRKEAVSNFVEYFLSNNEIVEMLCKQIGRPILPLLGSIKGGSSLIKSLFVINKVIIPKKEKPIIANTSYVKNSKNVSNVTPVVVNE